jgi:hypothetical protein
MPKTNGSFKKGDGRKRKPKGAINRTTKEARELLEQVLFGQIDNINASLNKLRSKDDSRYLDACSKLFTYVLPKKADITSDDKPISVMPQIVIKNGD